MRLIIGTIGGINVGVAPDANIYGVQVLDERGVGDYDSVLSGLDAVLDIRLGDELKPMAVSMSLAAQCPDNNCDKDPLVIAIEELYNHGITTIVAAGNKGSDVCNFTPGSSPHAITVGASTIDDRFASYSNWGACLDVYAPGDRILSACSSQTKDCSHSNDMYSYKSGTSMATPHVAGVVALWLTQTEDAQYQLHESPSPSIVTNALQCTSATDKLILYSGPNLLVQVPPPEYESFYDISCDLDFGCEFYSMDGLNISCQGNGECVAGVCRCNKGASGTDCEIVLPWWEYEPFCCDGQHLLDHDIQGPFNTIAFLWTDLAPNLGSVYYGNVRSNEAFIVVFDRVPFFEEACSTTVEVLIHSNNEVEIIFIYNELGYHCTATNISIGIKGGYDVSTIAEYEQISGPSLFAPEHLHVKFIPLFTNPPSITGNPTLAPSAAPVADSTSAPTATGLLSYNVTKLGYAESTMHQNYSALTLLNISADGYEILSLPFEINFFGRFYDKMYVSENGRLSFVAPSDGLPCCNGLDVRLSDSEIAFLWTDLSFETGGAALYGIGPSNSVIVVFNDVNPVGFFCTSTVEVLVHKDGLIKIVYLKNSIGYSCGSAPVSVGLVSEGASEYHQLYGPGERSLPYSETIMYIPLYNASQVYDEDGAGNDGIGSGGIIGIIAIGAVLCLSMIALLIYCFYKKRSEK